MQPRTRKPAAKTCNCPLDSKERDCYIKLLASEHVAPLKNTPSIRILFENKEIRGHSESRSALEHLAGHRV
jgi:hypothetical protein